MHVIAMNSNVQSLHSEPLKIADLKSNQSFKLIRLSFILYANIEEKQAFPESFCSRRKVPNTGDFMCYSNNATRMGEYRLPVTGSLKISENCPFTCVARRCKCISRRHPTEAVHNCRRFSSAKITKKKRQRKDEIIFLLSQIRCVLCPRCEVKDTKMFSFHFTCANGSGSWENERDDCQFPRQNKNDFVIFVLIHISHARPYGFEIMKIQIPESRLRVRSPTEKGRFDSVLTSSVRDGCLLGLEHSECSFPNTHSVIVLVPIRCITCSSRPSCVRIRSDHICLLRVVRLVHFAVSSAIPHKSNNKQLAISHRVTYLQNEWTIGDSYWFVIVFFSVHFCGIVFFFSKIILLSLVKCELAANWELLQQAIDGQFINKIQRVDEKQEKTSR